MIFEIEFIILNTGNDGYFNFLFVLVIAGKSLTQFEFDWKILNSKFEK